MSWCCLHDSVLRFLVVAATAAAPLIERLSPFHLIDRTALIVGWSLLAAAAAVYLWRRPREAARSPVTALTAWLSPPNAFDALAQHMPRIVYWAQSGSVRISSMAALLRAPVPAAIRVRRAAGRSGSGPRPRLPALQNWTRPLRGPHNLFSIPRDQAYFTDIPSPDAWSSYREAADRIQRAGCRTVAIDIGENQLEYPLQALLRERNRSVRFEHAGVANGTVRYAPPDQPPPCAVVCLECAGKPDKLAQYRAVAPPREIGRLVLFVSDERRTSEMWRAHSCAPHPDSSGCPANTSID